MLHIKYLKLNGDMLMTNFSTRQQSFISKAILYMVLSVHKIYETFNGNIKIEKYTSKINYENGILNLDGRVCGHSVDITVKGFVDTNENNVKIKGKIIPYGFINKGFSKVPIIGPILSGGEDEMIAAGYDVQGTTSNTKVMVNPITLLPLSFFKITNCDLVILFHTIRHYLIDSRLLK